MLVVFLRLYIQRSQRLAGQKIAELAERLLIPTWEMLISAMTVL
jgi:hypothetical protein